MDRLEFGDDGITLGGIRGHDERQQRAHEFDADAGRARAPLAPGRFTVQQFANAALVTLVDPSLLMARVPDSPFFEATPISTFVYVWVPMVAAGLAGGLIVGCTQVAGLGVRGSWRRVVVRGLGGVVAGPALGALFWWSMLSNVALHGKGPRLPIPSMEHTGIPGAVGVPSPLLTVAIGGICGALYGVLTGRVIASLLRSDSDSSMSPSAAG